MLSDGRLVTRRSFTLPMLKLVCKWDGYNIEESSLIITNLGLPEDFTRHMLKEHKLANPQKDIDYTAEPSMVTG